MAKPYDARLIAVVAQEQFEVSFDRFCKLVPVIYVDGVRPAQGDFPNDDEVWWMLSPQSATLARHGKLVSCYVEDARAYDDGDPTKSRYQAERESVRDLNPREDAVEVLTSPGDSMDSIEDVVSGGFRLKCDHPPSSTILLRWRSDVYGPLAATVEPMPSGGGFRASFAPSSLDMTVYQIPAEAFKDAAGESLLTISMQVSPSRYRRAECFDLRTVQHEFVLASGFERVLARNPKKLMLEPIDRKLIRFAKQCLTRKKRQELDGLLAELELSGKEIEDAHELKEAIGRVKTVTEKQDAALDTVSRALLNSGILGDDRLRHAEEEYAEKYIQERTAELQAKIELAASAKRKEAQDIESRLKDLQTTLLKEEADGRAKLKAVLDLEAENARKAIEAERDKLDRDKAELQRQEKALKQNLEKVTQELRDAGDVVVNRFLAIAPLLGSTVPSLPHRSAHEPDIAVKPPKVGL